MKASAIAAKREGAPIGRPRWQLLSRSYGQDNGLPNPFATAIAEDADGFHWVGIGGGLPRWNGYRLRLYVPVAGDAGALRDNGVTTPHANLQGRLRVATSAGGGAVYNRVHNIFKTYSASKPSGKGDLGTGSHLSSMNVRRLPMTGPACCGWARMAA